jgi:hypothetical protein
MFGKMKTDGRPITQLLLDEKTSDKERLGKCGSNFESDERRVTLFPGNGDCYVHGLKENRRNTHFY